MKLERTSRTVALRNPFGATKLGWALQFYLHSLSHDTALPIGLHLLVSPKWSRRIYRVARKCGVGTRGQVEFFCQGAEYTLEFNGTNTQFVAVYDPAYRYGYEQVLGALLDWLVPDDGTFLDIGSNWGYFGLYLSSRRSFNGRIYCFEPFPDSFSDLTNVVKQARLEVRVQCLDVGLSNAARKAEMILPNGIDSGLAEITKAAGSRGKEVELARLDDVASRNGISQIDFIKYDVEGSEYDALLGSRVSIERWKPMIFLESWKYLSQPEKTFKPLRLLREMDYVLFVPTWLGHVLDSPAILDQETQIREEVSTLVLIPVLWEDRFLLETRINLFACHSSRLRDLA